MKCVAAGFHSSCKRDFAPRPGKVSENVHALTFQKANERAMIEASAEVLSRAEVLRAMAGQSWIRL